MYLGILRSKLGDRGFAVTGSTGVKAKASREWAERNSVPYFATVGELNEATIDDGVRRVLKLKLAHHLVTPTADGDDG